MRIEVLTTFPEVFTSYMGSSIMGRAQKAGALEFVAHDLRDWTHDRHRSTDDEIYGGGSGLLMKPGPVFEALDDLLGCTWDVSDMARPGYRCALDGASTVGTLDVAAAETGFSANPTATHPALVVATAPVGATFDQHHAISLAACERIIFICGHYEGFDERILYRTDLAFSIGDYVLTGGELPAMVMADAIVRLLPGVLGDAYSAFDESFSPDNDGLLEYPQFTRPASFRGLDVPPVLLSGDHARIDDWRRAQARQRTARQRPDLL